MESQPWQNRVVLLAYVLLVCGDNGTCVRACDNIERYKKYDIRLPIRGIRYTDVTGKRLLRFQSDVALARVVGPKAPRHGAMSQSTPTVAVRECRGPVLQVISDYMQIPNHANVICAQTRMACESDQSCIQRLYSSIDLPWLLDAEHDSVFSTIGIVDSVSCGPILRRQPIYR